MELLQLPYCRSSAPLWRNMRHHFCFWFASFISVCPRGGISSVPVFAEAAVTEGVVRAAVLSVAVQQTVQKALPIQALLHSAQLSSLEASRAMFRGAAASSTSGNILGLSSESAGIRKDGRSRIMTLKSPTPNLENTPSAAWGNSRLPTGTKFGSNTGTSFEASGRLLPHFSHILSTQPALIERLQGAKPQTQSQTTVHIKPQRLQGEQGGAANVLEILAVEEASCRRAQQAVVAIDGGSSKTQPSLFSVLTESCTEGKRAGRHVVADTLKFVGDGGKFTGVRQLVERWLQRVEREKDCEPMNPQAIRSFQKARLQAGFPLLEQAAEELVDDLLKNMVELIEKHMNKTEQREAKALAIPVIFHSTAGLRDFPRWYAEGLFAALRRAINSAPAVKGFVFFTNQEFTRPISGQFEGVCAFLTANYLLGNLAKMKAEQRAHGRTDADGWLDSASAQAGDAVQQLGREVELPERNEKPTDESETIKLSSVFPSTAGGRKNRSDDTDAGCSAASPLSCGKSTRCRSGVPDIRFCAHEYLAAIVESGGASMQLAFPVRRLDLLPPDTRLYNLQRSGFLSDDYPPTDVVAVSFMQLGSNSAGGLFLKVLCSAGSPFVSQDGLCTNPCFHKGYSQPCSAGEVVISNAREVTVLEDPLHNRLRPVAVFCGEDNAEVLVKTSTQVECTASKLDPLEPLQRRLGISGCKRIVGSGDFDQCVDSVDRYLINPQFPLPANHEAIAAGFENPSQIFSFFSSRAPLLITGNSLVIPMRTLQTAGFLPPGELLFTEKDIDQIKEASQNYCGTPVVRDSFGTLRLSRNGTVRSSPNISKTFEDSIFFNTTSGVLTQGSAANVPLGIDLEMGMGARQDRAVETDIGEEKMGLKIDSLNYENCQRLATIVVLLNSIYTGVERPLHFSFTNELQGTTVGAERNRQEDKYNPKHVGKLGWQFGTILRHMSNENRWRKMVYEVGAAHSLHDRMDRENKSSVKTNS